MDDNTNPASPAATRTGTIDLSQCEREPIHIPGAIQPHGALLAVRLDNLLISHASANLAAILGVSPDAVFGQPLSAAIGEAASNQLHAALARTGDPAATAGTSGHAKDGSGVLLHAHRTGQHLCVDIEPVREGPEQRQARAELQAVLETFTHARSATELCERAVQGLKAITGYERVMAYRFDADESGEIIAEACDPGLDRYLGLRYPASDVPPQSRRIFLRHRISAIADSHYVPVPLLTDPDVDEGQPIDLTHSTLRSVSPLHREYLRNMNAAACLTVAVVLGQVNTGQHLWGMFVCHHATPRNPGPELRAAFVLIGQVVSLLLRSQDEAEGHAQRLQRNIMLGPLVDLLAGSRPLPDDIAAAETDLLRLVSAAGAMVQLSGFTVYLGLTPPEPAAERAMNELRAQADGRFLAIDDLTLSHPSLAACLSNGSGVIFLPLGAGAAGEDAILWFRPERSRTVTWGGDPTKHVRVDPATGRLSPRASFAAWKEIVRGQSVAWSDSDLATARALRQAVETRIAERTRAELARLRYYDPLTGLPNRSLLHDRLREAENLPDSQISLLFLDLDRFKAVNDSMGHSAGDALLVEVAQRLQTLAGPDNTPARLGGDEFVVLCQGMTREAVADLGERIRKAIETPFEIAGRPCHISASVGIAMAEQSGGLDLVRAADMAMYAAKQSGGNKGVLFAPALFDSAALQFELEHDLRAALNAGDQFVLLYQPLFSINRGIRRLAGFEALVRWRHPRRGWMSPGLFIPLAEKSGLIVPLGDWVLTAALRQGLLLRSMHHDANLVMNVNISASQIPRPGFRDGIAKALTTEGFPATALCLEVTESMLTDTMAATALTQVRELGVKVAIDDFGIGYSSLSYLRRLPVDVVKLDRSFLEDIDGDPRGQGFVGAVIALAHAAGKPVVFEGIETQHQFDIAVETGADVVQGFFFAPPLSGNAAEELVDQHHRLDAHHSTSVAKPG